MNKALKLVAIAAVMTIAAATAPLAQVPFCVFYDSTTTFNGNPVPVGSIIEAFDPDGVPCGKDTVLYAGYYGFMPVLGNDPSTGGIDEGAMEGDSIHFTLNGHPATVNLGDQTWHNLDTNLVSLSASTSNIAITGVKYPGDTIVGFNYTVRIKVGVRNDGDGLDYYGVNAVSSKGWNIDPQPNFVYANPGDTAFIYFDIDIPAFPGNDTVSSVSYSVFTYLDTTKHVDSSLQMTSSITVDIGDDIGDILPRGFVLEQNYPNPFNPTTNIAFEIPVRLSIRLEFYDVLGREIRTAELGSLSAGSHIYEFDGSNLSSGVYFYRMVTENFIQSRKMLLVK